MSRSGARPNYLGGIGLMLEVARVCPRCGKHLPDTPSASTWHLAGQGCRPPVFAALPEPEATVGEDDVARIPAGRQIRDFEVPAARAAGAGISGFPLAEPTVLPRSLAIPWLRPPDLGEVL
jgi:hypothetical protein